MRDLIWRLHASGWTVPEISDSIGVPKREVRRQIKTCWALDYDAGGGIYGDDSDTGTGDEASDGESCKRLPDVAD